MFRYDRLDELIAETGKKKNYLSTKIGHSGRYLNDAKKQNTNIKGEDLRILAEELNTTPEYLSGEIDIKEKPAPKTEDELLRDGQHINIVRIAGRDGSYTEKHLTDDQLKALQAIIDQLPDASEDL